jgi:radical SAM protein with 4Fe4S-binding SPASM domain
MRCRMTVSLLLPSEPCYRPITVRVQKSTCPLNTVYAEATRRCNLRCIHCYASSPTFSRCPRPDLSGAQWQTIIDELADNGVTNICFTGGEPFVRRDIPELLLHADARGLETAVFTNAVGLVPSDFDILAAIRPKFIAVGIDSHLPQTYQRIRGSDSWSKAVRNVEELVSRHLRPRLNCVIFKGINDSQSDIDGFLRFAREIGLGSDDVTFDEFCPEGEGVAIQERRVNELKVMDRIAEAFRAVFGVEYRQRPTEEDEDHESWSFCGIGTDMCYITHEAKVALCPALTTKEFIAGDMLNSPLARIWDQGEVFMFFREREYLVDSKCQSCKALPTCKAGCRAKALTFSGTMASHDPWMCAYFGE